MRALFFSEDRFAPTDLGHLVTQRATRRLHKMIFFYAEHLHLHLNLRRFYVTVSDWKREKKSRGYGNVDTDKIGEDKVWYSRV